MVTSTSVASSESKSTPPIAASEQPVGIQLSDIPLTNITFFKLGEQMPNVTMNNFTVSSMPGKILVFAFWNARKSESAGILDVIELVLRKKNWDSKIRVVAVEIEFVGPLSA